MNRRHRQHRDDGFVLVVVLILVLLLSALVFGFDGTMRIRLDAAVNFHEAEQAWNCARAGLNIAVAAVAEVNDVCMAQRLAKLVSGENTFAVGNGSCSVAITEENGRLNLNTLKAPDGSLNRTQIDRLLRLVDLLNRGQGRSDRIGYGIAPAIIDWTDADSEVTHLPFIEHQNMGAEKSYYRSLSSPYECANAPLSAVDEVLWVKGVTPDAFQRLQAVVTTFGDGKININTAPRVVIECLTETVDSALAQAIVDRRQQQPFESISDLQSVPGMTDNIYGLVHDSLTLDPEERYFRVSAQGNVDDRSCRIEAVLRRNKQTGNVDTILYKEL
jgi:general secretion pathway protein K